VAGQNDSLLCWHGWIISKALISLGLAQPIQLLELSFLRFWEERYHWDDEKKRLPVLYLDEGIVDDYLILDQGETRLLLKQ
jgi:hypothetical protein